MALQRGVLAPDFELPSTNGVSFKLSETTKNSPVILFFYPKDFTQGCTEEACSFSNDAVFFKQFNIPVYGISTDSIASHKKFIEAYKLNFDLLSDSSAKVAKLYDAKMPFLPIAKRVTYLIDKGGKIAAVYEGLFDAKTHIAEMKKAIESSFEKVEANK